MHSPPDASVRLSIRPSTPLPSDLPSERPGSSCVRYWSPYPDLRVDLQASQTSSTQLTSSDKLTALPTSISTPGLGMSTRHHRASTSGSGGARHHRHSTTHSSSEESLAAPATPTRPHAHAHPAHTRPSVSAPQVLARVITSSTSEDSASSVPRNESARGRVSFESDRHSTSSPSVARHQHSCMGPPFLSSYVLC
jgi:hypothetical protein